MLTGDGWMEITCWVRCRIISFKPQNHDQTAQSLILENELHQRDPDFHEFHALASLVDARVGMVVLGSLPRSKPRSTLKILRYPHTKHYRHCSIAHVANLAGTDIG